jgi:O-antigen ligase
MRPRYRQASPAAPAAARAANPGLGSSRAGVPRQRQTLMSWVVFAMFMTLIALFIPPDLATPGSMVQQFGAPSAALRTVKFVLLGLSILIIVSRLRLSIALLGATAWPFLAFLVLIPASVVWSITPSATIARYVSLLTVVLVCFCVALVDWNRERLQQVLKPILTMFLFGSLVVGIVRPDLVLEKGNDISLRDAWHGLASQKNEFGQLSSFGLILWLHAWLARESKFLVVIVGGGIAAACLFLSRSSTSILATVFALGLLLLLQRPPAALRRYMPYIVGVFTVLALTYAVAVLNLVPGLGILLKPFTLISGKDFTFSNRVLIWDVIKEHIRLSPLLGSGYGAYWIGAVPTSPSYVFLARMYIYPTQSHNGYLEVVNDLGFVGLVCLLAYLIAYIRQSLLLMRIDRAQAALYIALVFQQVFINLSEACWITARSASSNIMILATLGLARAILERRRNAPAAQAGMRR